MIAMTVPAITRHSMTGSPDALDAMPDAVVSVRAGAVGVGKQKRGFVQLRVTSEGVDAWVVLPLQEAELLVAAINDARGQLNLFPAG